MIARPGSFLWLVQHDLRLSWLRFRAMFGDRPTWFVLAVIGLCMVVFHLLAWPLAAHFLRKTTADALFPMIAGAALFVMPWQISQGINQSTRALYSRGDLDLLLASPVSERSVVAARALAMVVESVTSVGIFLFPIINMGALENGWIWLAAYPAVIASGFFATSLGLAMTVGLFRLLGPRRTRFAAQIVSTFIASIFIIGVQVVNVLPPTVRAEVIALMSPRLASGDGLIWLPVRAAMGGPLAMLGWCVTALVCFAFVSMGLGPSFLRSAIRSAGSDGPKRQSRFAAVDYRFQPGVSASLRRKEWKLLRRDPWLASQLMLQIVYTLPVSLVIWRSQGTEGSIALAVAPAVVVIASQLSASLAWLAISSEDAPEFIASAPVTRGELQRRKLEAIALPLALVLMIPILGLAMFEPVDAAITAAFAVVAAGSTALLNLWHPMPGKRSDVMKRHAQSKIVGLMEHLMSLCWAVAIVLAILGTMLFLVPALIVAGVLWANRPRDLQGRPAFA